MTDAQNSVSALLQRAWPAESWRNVHVLVAISGGADSTALLRAIASLKQAQGGAGRLFAAHVNHQMRGAESDADAQWVGDFCNQISVPLTIAGAQQSPQSEEEARSVRYELLQQMAGELGARYIVTAHTRDDQIETILHRIMRGTGMAGLVGIPGARPLSPAVTLVRPLLQVSRSMVEQYLRELCQDYRTDSTNLDRRYTRNWIRHELLPLLSKRTDGFAPQALLQLSEQAGEAQQVIASLAEVLLARHFDMRPGQILIAKGSQLREEPALVVREAIKLAWQAAAWPQRAMTSKHWQQIYELVNSTDRTVLNLPASVRAEATDQHVVLSRS